MSTVALAPSLSKGGSRGAPSTTWSTTALAAASCLALLGCGGSSNGTTTPSTAGTTQQAGGETAWVRTSSGGYGDSAQTLVALVRGQALTTIARQGAPGSPSSIVLLGVDASGAVAWTRSFGVGCGLEVRPLGPTSSGGVAALVKNACGAPVEGLGVDPIPAAGAIVLLDATGQFVRVVATPPDITDAAVDDAGHVLVLARSSAGTIVASVDDAGAERWRVAIPSGQRLVPAPGARAVVLLASQPAQLVEIDGTGAPGWTRTLPDGYDARDLVVLTDGAVAVLGALSRNVTWGSGAAGNAAGSGSAVLTTEPDGTPRTASDVASAAGGGPPTVIAAIPHGRVLLTAFGACDRLRALSPQLQLVWERPLDAGCAAAASAAATTTAGQIAIAGQFSGHADFGAGFGAGAVGPEDAFVLGVWP